MNNVRMTGTRFGSQYWLKVRIECKCGKVLKSKGYVIKSEIYLTCGRCGSVYCVVIPSMVRNSS